jgi:hypothetical protein
MSRHDLGVRLQHKRIADSYRLSADGKGETAKAAKNAKSPNGLSADFADYADLVGFVNP